MGKTDAHPAHFNVINKKFIITILTVTNNETESHTFLHSLNLK